MAGDRGRPGDVQPGAVHGGSGDRESPRDRGSQQRPGGSGAASQGASGSQGGQDEALAEVRRQYVVRLHEDVYDDLKALKKADPKTHRKVEELFGVLEEGPDIGGTPLRGEWEGCLAVHVGQQDNYRVIWEVLGAEPAVYDGDEEVEVIEIVILAVDKKVNARGKTIYQRPRPTT